MQEFSRLRAAAGTGEIVRVRYHGGTSPGSVRDVQPVVVDGEYVKGLCLASSAFKTFRLDRIEVVADSVPLTYDAGTRPQQRFATIADLAPQIVPLISDPERHVAVSPTSIAVHRLRRKDRKPFAYPDHELRLTDNDRKPWVVFGKVGRAYGSLDRAAEAFLRALNVTPPWPVEDRKRRSKLFDTGALGRKIYRPDGEAGEPVAPQKLRPTFFDVEALSRDQYRPTDAPGQQVKDRRTVTDFDLAVTNGPHPRPRQTADVAPLALPQRLFGRLAAWLRRTR